MEGKRKTGRGVGRERKAIAAVACPDCGAPRGVRCVRRSDDPNQAGRLFICQGRKRAWQMARDGELPEGKE